MLSVQRGKLVVALIQAGDKMPQFKQIVDKIDNDENGDYVAFSVEHRGKVAYAAKPEYRLDNDRRTRTTLARYLNRRIGLDGTGITPVMVDKFCSLVISDGTDHTNNFRIIRGRDIVDAYDDCIGGKSCMTGSDSDKVAVYAENDNVSMLVYKDNNFTARALLWETNEKTKVMDRIYPNDGYHVAAFHKWAVANGYVFRANNSLPSGDVELSDGGEYTVSISQAKNGLWPYIDTFHYGDDSNGNVTLSNATGSKFHVEFSCTSGGTSESTTCDNCNGSVDRDDIYHVDSSYYCIDCYSNECYTCDSCCEPYNDRNSPSTCADDSNNVFCPSCAENLHTCDSCNDIHENDACDTEVVDTGDYVCEHCRDEHSWQCYTCDQHYSSSTDKTEIDDESHCPDCAESMVTN